jgi:poly(beta-D-mannuronate) lyase
MSKFSLLALIFVLSIVIGCDKADQRIVVSDAAALKAAIANAQPGDEIVMADGAWRDIRIEFTGKGTAQQPIVLKAETPGNVIVEGKSSLKLGGEYLVVSGLYFKNGFTPEDAVIEFRINDKLLANHCRVTECVIEGFNQMNRDQPDHWVVFWGRHNQLDHCYIAGKSNQGPTIRVYIKGNESINNYHQIVNNHFGPRPRKGGPRGETIQIGDSYTSMSPSHTKVAGNLFEKCNGEVEVISSKTNFNEFRNNVFYKCEGSLVMRHGNYCTIEGNYFIGDEQSDNIGGVRIINTGHWVTNNYFYHLKGKEFRSPLAIMNGIPKSPLNRYNQVTDVVVAHNSWINCTSPWQFGVGSNVSQSEVLPLSEIRSARPIRTIVANNFIYNESGDTHPIVAHDEIDGIEFKNNIINNQGAKFESPQGLEVDDIGVKAINEFIYIPDEKLFEKEVFKGFDFETIDLDIFGNLRSAKNPPGAIAGSKDPDILNKEKYGPGWYSDLKEVPAGQVHTATPDNLTSVISQAAAGDIIELTSGSYVIEKPISVDKAITIRSAVDGQEPVINYKGPKASALFEMHPHGDLRLSNVKLIGGNIQYAFATLKENMSSLYNLSVEGVGISGFDYVLKAYKETFADEIVFKNTNISQCNNGIELSEETNDRGDYNVEFLTVEGCRFDHVLSNVIDYYRGGYDESTIGGNLVVRNSTFTNCGRNEENSILLNSRGIINVDISGNTFRNNPVKLVALLWGAKNNTHSDNEIINSGKLIVEENLELKLLY